MKPNTQITIIEQDWTGFWAEFLRDNRPFLSDDAIFQLNRGLTEEGNAVLDLGAGGVFHFKVANKETKS